jgi:hypothetical protein
MAADSTMPTADIRAMATFPREHAAAAVVVLLVATVLAVYKPKGMTRYGQRRQRAKLREQRTPSGS